MKIPMRIATIFVFVCSALFACSPQQVVATTDAAPTTSASSAVISSITRRFSRNSDDDVSPSIPVPNPPWYGEGPHQAAPKKSGMLMSTGFGAPPPVFQASWTQAAWFIDPANTSTCASDANLTCSLSTCGTTGDGPCSTYAQVAARWGTYSPRLRQTTTITFMSSQPDTTDPVLFRPSIENSAVVTIMGALPTASASGTLVAVTSKNQGTGTLLNATFAATTSTHNMVVNTTHPSRAFVYSHTAGNAYNMTEPLTAFTNFSSNPPSTEVDTWTAGDSYSIYTLFAINLVDIEPTFNPVNIYQCVTGVSSGGQLTVNANVNFAEVRGRQFVSVTGQAPPPNAVPQGITNSDFASGNGLWTTTPPSVFAGSFFPAIHIYGGHQSSPTGTGYYFDQDIIIDPGVVESVGQSAVSNVYVSSGTKLSFSVGVSSVFGPVYGPGGVDAAYGAALFYPAGTAAANFLVSGGITLGQNASGCSHSSAAPDVVDCGITLTAAHLDAAQGVAGFGGYAFLPGGAMITSTGGF